MKKDRKFADGSQSHALGTAIIIVVMLAVVGGVGAFMHSVGLLTLPPPLNRLFDSDDGKAGEVIWDLGELSELVRGERHADAETMVLRLESDTLYDAFLTEEKAPGIAVTGRVSYFNEGEAVPHRVIYRRSGEDFRAEIYARDNTDQLETLKIRTGSILYVRDAETGEFRSLPSDGTITGEMEAGIPSVAEILTAVAAFPRPEAETISSELDEKKPLFPVPMPAAVSDEAETAAETEAEPSLYADCSLAMVSTAAGSVYYVEFTYADIGVREEFTIAPDFCIVLSAKTTAGGETVYAYETISYSLDASEWQDAKYYDVTR